MDTASPDPLTPPGSRFRLGLIGAGRMGMTHLEAIQSSENLVVAGVVDPRAEVRSALRAAGKSSFASLEELLAAKN